MTLCAGPHGGAGTTFCDVLHFALEDAFGELLRCWREHHRRRALPTSTTVDLAHSRIALDSARQRMHSLRIALLPRADERASVIQSVWCESLETVIHLSWSMRHPDFPGRFVCPCGHDIDADWDVIDEVSGRKQDT